MTEWMIRVAKLGGSLLDLDDLSARIESWLGDEEPAKTVLVVGGGPLVRMLQPWSTRRDWSEERAHWAAIQMMGVNATRVSRLVESWQLVYSLQEVIASESQLVVLDVESTLQAMETGDDPPLPSSWEVTSDSIAARVAVELGAGELVLLKSISAGTEDLGELAAQGVVDCHFPRAAEGLRVRIINLREREPLSSTRSSCSGPTGPLSCGPP
ncbi:MAG: hypothetical protein VB817_09360 [Pirellulaceae bacterium]